MSKMGELSPNQSFEEVMDTPESKNNQIATSASKFEESPVYNFLNGLSPIQPIKATHMTQRINLQSFASPPTVFTSPHASSFRESRFMRKHHQPSDPSKSECRFDHENFTDDKNKEHREVLDHQPEDMNTRPSADGMTYGPSYERSSSPLIPEECSQSGLCVSDMNPDGINQIDHNKESSTCDWESLIDASGLFMFESPNDSESCKKSVGLKPSFCTSIESDLQITRSLGAMDPGEHVAEGSDPESMFTQPGDATDMAAIDGNHCMIPEISTLNPTAKMDFEDLSGIYRGMRRRCLVFEVGGSRRKQFNANSAFDSSVLPQSEESSPANDPQLVKSTSSTKNNSSHFVVPAPGLHLNAVLTIPKDRQIANHQASASGKRLIISNSTVNLHSPSIGQEFLNTSQEIPSSEREIDTFGNSFLPEEDSCSVAAYGANEEVAQSSPKKKKRKFEQSSEGGTCKRCNCRKSKCLKLYCECFAAGVYCVEPCACIDCFNRPFHEETVLATRRQIESRNPLAFAPRVIKSSDFYVSETMNESSKTPASARHKRGCNCKKSGCLKKYCECYQGGVGCSINCRCEGCKNAFGKKHGCGVMNMEIEFQEDNITENSVLEDRSLQEIVMKNDREHRTPLQPGRHTLSKTKPPRSSGLSGKQSFSLPASSMLKKNFVEDEEIPEILQGNMSSPMSSIIKSSSSPNGKRVSSPHGMFGMKNSRKLILRSIPSFPSSDL